MEKGRVVHSPIFILRVLKKDGVTGISAVAPNKIAKTAVLRTKTRRQIYSAISKFINKIQPGYRVIIFAKNDFQGKVFSDIELAIKDIFVKAGIME